MTITNAGISFKLRTLVSRSATSGCTPPDEEIWFPVAPTVTQLPPAPAATTNPETVPADSAVLPPDFDEEDPDICALFTSILSESTPAVYEEEMEAVMLVLPFNEINIQNAYLRTSLNLYRYNYSLKPRQGDCPFVKKVLYYIARLYKFKKTNINYDATVQDATIRKTWKITASPGEFSSEFPNAAIRPIKIFCDTGSLALSFAAAGIDVPGTFSYGWESTADTGTGANPIAVAYRRNIHLTIYPASILLAGGARAGVRFVNLRWYVTNSVPANNSILGMNIRLYHSAQTDAESTVVPIESVKTTVYSDSATTEFLQAETLGVLQIDFSTPFKWDGVNSLVVESCTSQNQSNYTSRGALRSIGTEWVRRYTWTDSVGSSCSSALSYMAQGYIATQMDFE